MKKYLDNLFIISIFIILILFTGCINNSKETTHNNIMIKQKSFYPNIQSAIQNASNGDEIIIHDYSSNESIIIDKPIKITGEENVTLYLKKDDYIENYIIRVISDNCTLKGIKIIGLEQIIESTGIDILSSGNNISNNIIENFTNGIYLSNNSRDNIIKDNKILKNENGIYSRYTYKNNITGNTISNCTEYGLWLQYNSNHNIIFGNVFINNNYGTRIKGARNNTFTRNIIMNNKYGLYFCCGSQYNLVFNNLFKNNSHWNARDYVGTNNWSSNDIGNFWDDYLGNDSDNNGIGDEPYLIAEIPRAISTEYVQDHHPIMKEQFETD